MAGGAERARDAHCGFDLDSMALSVIHRQAPALMAFAPGPGKRGRGIQPAGQEDNRFYGRVFYRLVPC